MHIASDCRFIGAGGFKSPAGRHAAGSSGRALRPAEVFCRKISKTDIFIPCDNTRPTGQ
jgi:hypothetical protein